MAIFEPGRLGNVTFENRVLRSSVGGRMCAYNGMVTDVWKNFEMRFAAGGVGGMISTTFNVDPERQSPLEYPSIADDRYIAPLRNRLAEIKSKTGCRYIVQIGDPGYATQMSLFPQRADALSSSSGFDFLYGYVNRRIEMTAAEIEQAIERFAAAALRAREAGADGIEITAEKGYLIHQFLNPGMNRRTDAWGGTPEKRFRFLAEIVRAVRKRVGEDFLVGVRIAAVDHNSFPIQAFLSRWPIVFPLKHHVRGNNLPQMLAYARELKTLGVGYFHVVQGYGFINPKGNPGTFPVEEIKLFVNATRHLGRKAAVRAALINLVPNVLARPLFNIGWRYQEGISLDYADAFRRETGLPVIANGGFQNRTAIEGALQGKADFVSMARALIANPDLLKLYRAERTIPQGKECLFCNKCCARTATSPLGCYNEERFASLAEMQEQILAYNMPDP